MNRKTEVGEWSITIKSLSPKSMKFINRTILFLEIVCVLIVATILFIAIYGVVK